MCSGCSIRSVDEYQTITVGDVERKYLVSVPTDLETRDFENGLSVLFALHGDIGNAAYFRDTSGFDALVNREGLIVVYPEGTALESKKAHVWNTDYVPTKSPDVDDVAFLEQLIDHIIGKYSINPSHVYMTGHSMGARLAHQMAARMPERFAGVAPVSSSIGGYPCDVCGLYTPPKPSVPVPIVYVHGTNDTIAPFYGGKPTDRLMDNTERRDLSVADTVEWWVKENGCNPSPRVKRSESGAILVETYSGGSERSRVTAITVDGANHFWSSFDSIVGQSTFYEGTLANLIWTYLRRNRTMYG